VFAICEYRIRKVKQIGDCSNLENCRGVKALRRSTRLPSALA
jgi:hypothetical protein